MKKILIPLFIFIGVSLLGLFFNRFSVKSVNVVKQKEIIIHIIPLGDIGEKYPKLVKTYIQNFYGFKCVINSNEKLTNDLVSNSGKRYDAGKIITKYNSNKNILLLTNEDIVHHNKTKNIKEYGIIGLGLRPGKTCVVSTFRIKKNVNEKKMLDRLRKVVIHEVGHNLGLKHCTYNKECLMNDARGTVKQIDRERVWLCDNCRRIIKIYN